MKKRNFVIAFSLLITFAFVNTRNEGNLIAKADTLNGKASAQLEKKQMITSKAVFEDDDEYVKMVNEADGKTIKSDSKASKNDNEIRTRGSFGSYSQRKGVINVTNDKFKGILPTGHAAIVIKKGEVVESNASGVEHGKNDWNTSKGQVYQVTVLKTSAANDEKAADWANKKKGKKYNYNYFDINTRKKFYCSQLVWASYKDNFKIDLNTSSFKTPLGNPIHPMELVNSNQSSLIYRKK